jgi:hypothetical protein
VSNDAPVSTNQSTNVSQEEAEALKAVCATVMRVGEKVSHATYVTDDDEVADQIADDTWKRKWARSGKVERCRMAASGKTMWTIPGWIVKEIKGQGPEASPHERDRGDTGREGSQGPDEMPKPKRSHGGIGQGYKRAKDFLETASGDTEGRLGTSEGDVCFDRLGSDEEENGGEDDRSESYLITEMIANYYQRNLLGEKVQVVDEQVQTPYRHFIIHLLHSAQIYWTDQWHPIHHETLIEKLPGGYILDEISDGTSRLWDFGGSIIQVRDCGDYVVNERTREYRIDPRFAIKFWELADKADANYKMHEEKGEAGKRHQGSSALMTEFRDDSDHRWGKKEDLSTGHYSLVDGALRVLSEAEHKIDISAVTEMKEILEKEYESTVRNYDEAKRRYETVAYFDEEGGAKTDDEAEQIREARHYLQSTETRKEKAEGRYHALLAGLEVITRQADRIEDGTAYIQNAYEVQPISGRFSFRRGGPQGLPAVLKSFAYSFEDVYNYDIKSSQTTGLRQLATELQELGYDVDTQALDDYIESGGKDWVVEEYDLPRSLVKRVEHAVKFGGKIPASMEQAYYQKENTRWGMPEIASHVEEYYNTREGQNRALSDLKEIFEPQIQMIEELAEGLLTEYWDAHSQPGGRGKGRYMRNHAGITFCKHDYPEGHTGRSKAMAWYLQGLEAAYVHAITILSEEYDYEVMANEHDGCITIGKVSQEAKDRAKDLSGSYNAELVDKHFEDEEVVREVCDKINIDYPSPPLETEWKTNGPGESEQQKRPGTTPGFEETTSPTASSPKTQSENGSRNALPVGDGQNGTTTASGDRPASHAPGRAESALEELS